MIERLPSLRDKLRAQEEVEAKATQEAQEVSSGTLQGPEPEQEQGSDSGTGLQDGVQEEAHKKGRKNSKHTKKENE